MNTGARTNAGHQDENATATVEAEVAVVGEHGGEASPGSEREALVGGEILGLETDIGSEGADRIPQQGDSAFAHLVEISFGAAADFDADGTAVVEESGDAAASHPMPGSRREIEQQIENAAVGALAAGEVADLAFDVVEASHLGQQRAIDGGGGQESAQNRARWICGMWHHERSRYGRGTRSRKETSSAGISGMGSEAR